MNLTLNFVDPKVIDQRLIEAENLKAQATREEDFEKQPTSVTKSRNTRKCKGNMSLIRRPLSSVKTIEHIVEQKPIFLLVI